MRQRELLKGDLVGLTVTWQEVFPVWDEKRPGYLKTSYQYETALIVKATYQMVWLASQDGRKFYFSKPQLLEKVIPAKRKNDKEVLKILTREVDLINNPPAKKYTRNKNRTQEIYTLADPDTREVFYIGISDNVLDRYKQHCLCNNGANSDKNAKIKALRTQGKFPL